MLDAIHLDGLVDKHVQFWLESIEPNEHIMEYSQTIDLRTNGFRAFYKELLKNEVDPLMDWEEIEFLVLVFLLVEEPTNLKEPLLRLLTQLDLPLVGGRPQGNGLVVSIDANYPDFKLLHKPKRTKGKVSNSLG